MKSGKRLLATICFVLLLTACGNENEPNNKDNRKEIANNSSTINSSNIDDSTEKINDSDEEKSDNEDTSLAYIKEGTLVISESVDSIHIINGVTGEELAYLKDTSITEFATDISSINFQKTKSEEKTGWTYKLVFNDDGSETVFFILSEELDEASTNNAYTASIDLVEFIKGYIK